jgi:hypothetical protein
MGRQAVRLIAKCDDCSFENPRGWVTCARCGALLGPQLRRTGRLESDSEIGATTARYPASTPLATEPEGEEKTQVYRALATPEASTAVAAAQGDLRRPRTSGHADARPLLGQTVALGELQRSLETAFTTRQARLLVLQGGAGAGKTRMLHRASEIAAAMRSDVRVQYAALRSRDDGPYAPFSRLLLERFGITPASSPSAVRKGMEIDVAATLGDSERVAETTHLLGHVAGVPFPESALLRELERDPAALHGQVLAALARLAAGDAQRSPALWLLDDLTEAQTHAWELLETLLDLSAPLVVIAAGRSPIAARAAAMGRKSRLQSVELRPLSASDAAELVRMLMPEHRDPSDTLISVLMQRSNGNPRQLVELVRMLHGAPPFR